MSDDTPDLVQVIRDAVEQRLVEVRVSLPGRVQSYDQGKQEVDVILQAKRPVPKAGGGFVYEDLPVLPQVPVQFPRGGGFAITWPLAAGDAGLVVFTDWSLERWRATGQVSAPGDLRVHGMSGCIFIPGVFPNAERLADPAVASEMRIGKVGGASIGIDDDVRLGAPTASDFVALASKVAHELAAIQTTLGTGANSGGAVVFGTPYVPGSVAATKVKAV